MHFHSFGEFATRYGLEYFGSANGLTAALWVALQDPDEVCLAVAAILVRMTAHIAHIIPSFSVAMSDSKSTVSKTDSMCPLGMVEFPAGNQNSDVLLAWGKLCRINSLKPPFEHVAHAACFSTPSRRRFPLFPTRPRCPPMVSRAPNSSIYSFK